MLLLKIGHCTITHQMYWFTTTWANGFMCCIATSLVVIRPCCKLTVRKVDEHTKLFSSLTQRFFRNYTLKVAVGRIKQRMKTESPALAGQRETTCHEEKESRDRRWIFFLVFYCSSNMFVRWFRFRRFVSGVSPLFRAHLKMGAATLGPPHIAVSIVFK